MALRCVSIISDLNPEIGQGLLSRGEGLILLIHTEKPCHNRDCFHDMKHGILRMNSQDKSMHSNIIKIH